MRIIKNLCKSVQKKKPKLSEIIDEPSVRKAIIASSDPNNLLSMKDLVASGLQINYFGEVVNMINDKTVTVIKDSSFGHNTNIQSDHNTQSVDVINDPYKESFDELFEQIRKLEHLGEQENAFEDAKGARKAMAQNNKERAKKLLLMLPDVIKTTSAFISLYHVVNTN